MTPWISRSLAAATLVVAAYSAHAAPLGLDTTDPTVIADGALLTYLEDGGEGAFTSFADVTGTSGGGVGSALDLFFDAAIDLSTTAAVFGTVDVSDGTNGLVTGDLVDFGFTSTSLEFLFDVFGGSASNAFGSQALLTFTLGDDQGAPFLDNLSSGQTFTGELTLAAVDRVAPIPLPAGGVLLLTALGGGLLIRRRVAKD